MISGENRRSFFGALFLAGGSAAAFAESFRNGGGTGHSVARDSLFEHIQQQLAAILGRAQLRGGIICSEDAAAAASCMRVCAAHARGLGFDQIARDALAARLMVSNRDVVIAATPDLSAVRRRLRRNGFVISDRIVRDLSLTNHGARVAALDAIQQGRTTAVCDHLAEALELAAPRLAKEERAVLAVAAQDDWWCNFYVGQWSMYLALAWMIGMMDDPAFQEYLDSVWAGFVFYDQLYTSQC